MSQGEAAISEFRPDDQDEVRSLILTGLRERWGQLDESLNPDLRDIRSAYRNGRTVVVRYGPDIVGTGTVVPRDPATAEILRMSVASDHRRRGLGRLVVDELLGTARAWGAKAVVLETSTSWDEAVAFYCSCGFVITHREVGAFGEDTWFRLAL